MGLGTRRKYGEVGEVRYRAERGRSRGTDQIRQHFGERSENALGQLEGHDEGEQERKMGRVE